jgi:hypothetical protein
MIEKANDSRMFSETARPKSAQQKRLSLEVKGIRVIIQPLIRKARNWHPSIVDQRRFKY